MNSLDGVVAQDHVEVCLPPDAQEFAGFPGQAGELWSHAGQNDARVTHDLNLTIRRTGRRQPRTAHGADHLVCPSVGSGTVCRIVAFRSAKGRPFAERKETNCTTTQASRARTDRLDNHSLSRRRATVSVGKIAQTLAIPVSESERNDTGLRRMTGSGLCQSSLSDE